MRLCLLAEVKHSNQGHGKPLMTIQGLRFSAFNYELRVRHQCMPGHNNMNASLCVLFRVGLLQIDTNSQQTLLRAACCTDAGAHDLGNVYAVSSSEQIKTLRVQHDQSDKLNIEFATSILKRFYQSEGRGPFGLSQALPHGFVAQILCFLNDQRIRINFKQS